MSTGIYKHKSHTKKWIKWMSNYMKKYPNSGQFKKGHKQSKEILLKLGKALKKAHKLHPEIWKRTKKEIKQMRKRSKQWHKEHPIKSKKIYKAMIKANKKRIYKKKTTLEKKRHSKKMKKYYKTHQIWNKGLKTGLIPKTAFKSGILHPDFIDGRSFLPYSFEFNKFLKNKIRQRDHYKCQKCNISEQKHILLYNRVLDIHHIDYNKFNCNLNNLITLCKKCNSKANFNRDYWFAYFTYIMENYIYG